MHLLSGMRCSQPVLVSEYLILQDSSFAKCTEVDRECEEKGKRGLCSLILLLLLPGRKQKEKEKCSGGNKNGELRNAHVRTYTCT